MNWRESDAAIPLPSKILREDGNSFLHFLHAKLPDRGWLGLGSWNQCLVLGVWLYWWLMKRSGELCWDRCLGIRMMWIIRQEDLWVGMSGPVQVWKWSLSFWMGDVDGAHGSSFPISSKFIYYCAWNIGTSLESRSSAWIDSQSQMITSNECHCKIKRSSDLLFLQNCWFCDFTQVANFGWREGISIWNRGADSRLEAWLTIWFLQTKRLFTLRQFNFSIEGPPFWTSTSSI